MADAIDAGARYIQFDFPLYPYLVDPAWIERFGGRARCGHVVDAALAADPAVLEGIPDDVTVGLHICRGNYRSSWMCEGSLEPVAERVFGQLPFDTFLVEWDDLGRDGGFEPIRFLRDGSTMVMGIVSHQDPRARGRGRPDAADGTGGRDRRRLNRLAISPQCGFASVMVGNETDEDIQWRKLELVGRVADRLWEYSQPGVPSRRVQVRPRAPAKRWSRPLSSEGGRTSFCTDRSETARFGLRSSQRFSSRVATSGSQSGPDGPLEEGG